MIDQAETPFIMEAIHTTRRVRSHPIMRSDTKWTKTPFIAFIIFDHVFPLVLPGMGRFRPDKLSFGFCFSPLLAVLTRLQCLFKAFS